MAGIKDQINLILKVQKRATLRRDSRSRKYAEAHSQSHRWRPSLELLSKLFLFSRRATPSGHTHLDRVKRGNLRRLAVLSVIQGEKSRKVCSEQAHLNSVWAWGPEKTQLFQENRQLMSDDFKARARGCPDGGAIARGNVQLRGTRVVKIHLKLDSFGKSRSSWLRLFCCAVLTS